jgi:hypothetical protein
MHIFCNHISDSNWDLLKKSSKKAGISITSIISRLFEAHSPYMIGSLSGAMVLGIQAITTSGTVWISKGF